jgi:hypothetical protein
MVTPRLREDVEDVLMEERLESAFGGHPHGLRLQESLELLARCIVAEVIGYSSN